MKLDGLKLIPVVILLSGTVGCRLFISEEQFRRMEDARTRETDAIIAESPVLQELERDCMEIPRFDDFVYQTKDLSSGRRSFIVYGYKSGRSYPEVESYYEKYFMSNGWTFEEDSQGLNTKWISYTKGNFRVSVNYADTSPRENFTIVCERLRD
jgi:hypothetical protein